MRKWEGLGRASRSNQVSTGIDSVGLLEVAGSEERVVPALALTQR